MVQDVWLLCGYILFGVRLADMFVLSTGTERAGD